MSIQKWISITGDESLVEYDDCSSNNDACQYVLLGDHQAREKKLLDIIRQYRRMHSEQCQSSNTYSPNALGIDTRCGTCKAADELKGGD